MVAQAAESALSGRREPPPGLAIDVVAAFASGAEGTPSALLGSSGPSHRSSTLPEAIGRHLGASDGSETLAVEVESDPQGARATACLLGAGAGWPIAEADPGEAPALPSTFAAFDRLIRSPLGSEVTLRAPGGPAYRIRKAREIPTHGPAAPMTGEGAHSIPRPNLDHLADPKLLTRVSEGAYIPRASYLEALPARWRFMGSRCDACGRDWFPPRGACPKCGSGEHLHPHSLPLHGGTIVALTTIGKGGQPTEFDPWVDAVGPYQVAIVELAPGCRATLQVTDALPGELSLGQRVSTRLRRLYPMEGEWRYGRKAVPLDPADLSPSADR